MVDQVSGRGEGVRAVARVAPPAAASPALPVTQAQRERSTADIASLSGIATQLAARPPVDVDRVREIKHAIANGTFPILPATIADRLLALRYNWNGHDQA